jgi:hypothetical protein
MREEKENEKTIINSCTGRNDDIFIMRAEKVTDQQKKLPPRKQKKSILMKRRSGMYLVLQTSSKESM